MARRWETATAQEIIDDVREVIRICSLTQPPVPRDEWPGPIDFDPPVRYLFNVSPNARAILGASLGMPTRFLFPTEIRE